MHYIVAQYVPGPTYKPKDLPDLDNLALFRIRGGNLRIQLLGFTSSPSNFVAIIHARAIAPIRDLRIFLENYDALYAKRPRELSLLSFFAWEQEMHMIDGIDVSSGLTPREALFPARENATMYVESLRTITEANEFSKDRLYITPLMQTREENGL